MISLRYGGSGPIYEQIMSEFKKQIVGGIMPPGEKLPSVRELSVQLSINPNTIQRAYRELEAQHYIYTVSGKGSFVAEGNAQDSEKLEKLSAGFREILSEMKFLGYPEQDAHDDVSRVYEGSK